MAARQCADSLTIGPLARAAGCTVQTVRYYEEIGLLPRPARTEGNQRCYSASDERRLSFIRHARELGFPLQAVRDLLSLTDHPEQPCQKADAIARRQLAAVETRIQRLTALKVELERISESCAGGSIGECCVIEALGDHGLCGTDHMRGKALATDAHASDRADGGADHT
jgi:DNA-binding transcriptional MerR regulator